MSQWAAAMLEAALAHEGFAAGGLQRAEEDETIHAPSFDEDIEQPVHAVIEVNIGIAGAMLCDELPRAGAVPGVSRFIVDRGVGLGLHDDAGAFAPDQFAADQFA